MLLVGQVTGGSGILSSESEIYLSQIDVSRAPSMGRCCSVVSIQKMI